MRPWFKLNPHGPVVGGLFNKPIPQQQQKQNQAFNSAVILSAAPAHQDVRGCFLKDVGRALQNQSILRGVVFVSITKAGLHCPKVPKGETIGTFSFCDMTGTLSGTILWSILL